MERTDTSLREYLLGSSSPEETERIESQLLEDGDLFAALQSAEDDLFDAYARGRLTAPERARFQERFGHHTDRLRFAAAFAHQTDAGRMPPAARRPWIPLAAAAALVLAAGIVFTQIKTPSAPPVATGPQAPPEAPAVPAPFTVALTLGLSRAAGSASQITIPAGTTAVRLDVRIDPADRFDTYAMELRGPGDRAVWNGTNLVAGPTSGTLTVSAQIPATALSAGSYELVVRGGGTDLGFVPLTVRWSP